MDQTPRTWQPRERWGYGATIAEFLLANPNTILGALAAWSDFSDELAQKAAWMQQIEVLKQLLASREAAHGAIYFEYAIPRLGRRIDTVLILEHVLFVLEFKVGATEFGRNAIDQVWDYALDLKNFHDASHPLAIVPMLIATGKCHTPTAIEITSHQDLLTAPVLCGADGLARAIELGLEYFQEPLIDSDLWQRGHYRPTPTIVEAARALYAGHAVEEISRHDAGAKNLAITSHRLSQLIEHVRTEGRKAIFLITGVPGAGKTLVGLDIANRHTNSEDELYSVFLSGNGPLVSVLHEALARDHQERANAKGGKLRIGEARSAVKQFIQNVHHFRDDCLASSAPPIEHIALFDEAQRAWDLTQTASFMQGGFKPQVQHPDTSPPSWLGDRTWRRIGLSTAR